jgi:phospholipid/cholesterol/gamma-HCH transport system permease protein
MLAAVGRPAVETYRAGLELWQLLEATIAGALRRRGEPGAALQQMFRVGNRSLVFILITIGFIAMVSIYEICHQINLVTGDLSQVGLEFLKLLSHESAPTITAMMLCTRVGAGIAAEIGSMVVTEQIDALRMNGVDPVDYLIVPRFLACLVMVPVLVIYGALIAVASATAMTYFHFGLNPRIFLNPAAVAWTDVLTGMTKSLAYGAAIPVVAGYCGLTAGTGAQGVGSATTRAVISCSLAVLVLDFLIGAASFVLFHSGMVGT